MLSWFDSIGVGKKDESSRNETLVVVVVVTGLLLYTTWTFYRRYLESKKPFTNLPMLPNSHWFFGHIRGSHKNLEESMHHMCIAFADEFGRTGFWLMHQAALTVNRYKDARAILSSSSKRLAPRIYKPHFDRFLGPRNILMLNGETWKFHRNAMQRALNPTAVERSQDAILNVVQTLLQAFQNNNKLPMVDVNVESIMKMITMDAFGSVFLTENFGCCENLEPSPLAAAFDFLGTELTRRMKQPMNPFCQLYWLPTATNRRHARERALIRNYLRDIVAARRSTQTKPKDLLTGLLEAHQEFQQDKDDVSDDTLTDVLMSLLFAGYDTTSIVLSYATFLLATHPQEQERLVEEVKNNSDYHDLVYCRAVVLETLRLYPSVQGVTRSMTKDLTLDGGFTVRAGTHAYIPIWAVQRMEFAQPESFLPTRWVTQNNKIWTQTRTDGPKTLLAFSSGARSCVGQKFAMQEATLVLASLWKHLRFYAKEGYKIKPVRAGFVQRPEGGIPMTIEWRTP